MSESICLGVIGGGQLGSVVFCRKKIKSETVVLSDDKDGPAQKICDNFIIANMKTTKNKRVYLKLMLQPMS